MLTNCKIFVAKTAGFCFGVDNALKIVYNKLNSRHNVATLGPIIHNPNVVADLEQKGVKAIDITQAQKGQTVIIRSHGVGRNVYKELEAAGAETVDATCPFVSRIHKLVYEHSKNGGTVLIAGDKAHPEVEGIMGHCEGDVFTFKSESGLEAVIRENALEGKGVLLVSQTTFNKAVFLSCEKLARALLPEVRICDTICNATAQRQQEARELAKKADVMIIVGGRHSSNTLKLRDVCSEFCRTVLVETANELKAEDFEGAEYIGISAGASTPAYIIKEVQQTMSELTKTTEEEVFNFEEELEKTLKKIHTGQKVEGYIISIDANGEVKVDIGTKHTGIIPANELTDDPSLKPEDVVKPGDTVELIILKTSDTDGIVTLSKKKVDAVKGFEKIVEAKENDTALTGVVTNVVKGGVLVSAGGVKVFIPASQATARRDDDLNALLKKTVDFKILEVNEGKQRAVGSIRALLKEQRAAAQAAFFEKAEAGQTITGEVKSVTDYGAFVDLGGVDGLVRKADLTWKRIKNPSDVVKVGDTVEVTIKDIDKEAGKVSLTMKKDSENPWNIFKNTYEVGQTISAKIVSITSFGAFAQIIDGVDGLIHISQIANKRVNSVGDILKVGDEVEAKIIEVNDEQKRISLSIRALLPEGEEEEAAETETEEVEE
mgnify:CR=1 FL=1